MYTEHHIKSSHLSTPPNKFTFAPVKSSHRSKYHAKLLLARWTGVARLSRQVFKSNLTRLNRVVAILDTWRAPELQRAG